MTRATRKNVWLWLALIMLLAGDVVAQETADEFSDWACKRCPEYSGWYGNADFGLGWLSDDSLRFGNYRGLDEKGAYAAVDGNAHYLNTEGLYIDLRARDLGIDSRELDVRGGRQGRYELRFGWHEIPTWRGYGAQTPFTGQRSDLLTLPADWVYASSTGEMTALQANLMAAPLKMQRKTLDAGLTLKFASRWSWDIDTQRQEKTGTRLFGGAGMFMNNAALLPAPVDFTTDQLNMGLNWGTQRAQVRLGYFGSWFDNGRNSLTWDNPFTSTPETSTFRSALEPDNEFHQFTLTGAWAVTPRIHLSGHAATGEMSQDDPFLPYSINPDFSDLALPRASLDGRVDTSVVNLGGKISARLSSRWSITARAKYDERDNRTPIDEYTPVTSDAFILEPRSNRPYSFERTRFSVDARFRAHRTVRLMGGAERYDLDRTLQSVSESEETTLWGEVKWTPDPRVQMRFRLEDADRDISEYQAVDDLTLPDHPLMRKFNQADRDRQRLLLEAYFTLPEGLSLNLSLHDASDEYRESMIGLQSSDTSSYTIGLDYALGEKFTVYGFITRDEIDALMTGAASLTPDHWSGSTGDQIDTAGLGLSTTLSERASLGLDVISASSKGDITVNSSENHTPYPTLRTDLLNTRFYFDFQLNEHWGYHLWAEYEDFSSKDWAIDNLGVDGMDSVLTLGLHSPDYSIWNLRAQATYRF